MTKGAQIAAKEWHLLEVGEVIRHVCGHLWASFRRHPKAENKDAIYRQDQIVKWEDPKYSANVKSGE